VRKTFKILSKQASIFLREKIPQNNLDKDDFVGLDWEAFVKDMQRHKLESVVWHSIGKYPELFPKVLFQQLRKFKMTQNERKVRLTQEIWRIQQAFKNQHIVILSYKGLCLAAQAYPFVQQRECNDIDFAISRKDIINSATIMRELGYVELKGESNFEKPEKSRSYHIDYSWVLYDEDKNIICNAEIHWQPANSALYVPFIFEDFMHHSTTIKLNNFPVTTFSLVHHALIVLVHHAIVDTWSQLRHLVDFALLLQKMDTDSLKQFEKLCHQYGLWHNYQYGLFLLDKLIDCRIEKTTLSYKELAIPQQLLQQIERGNLLGHWSKRPIKFYYYLRMRDTIKDQWKSLGRFIWFTLLNIKLSR